jgi:hypothetical protein
MQLRPYQVDLSRKWAEILEKYWIVYFAMEVRTGKTLTALETIRLMGYKNVLFITKKRAFSSIEKDYEYYKDFFGITIINKESIHKIEGLFDCMVLDEAHQYGALPKPWMNTKIIHQKYKHLPTLYLSGTPSPESYSQMYHQLWISQRSIWSDYSNFYKWARDYVTIGIIHTSYWQANDYSKANDIKIKKDLDPIMLSFSQNEAGFSTTINEKIHCIPAIHSTYGLAKKIIKDRVIEGKDEIILADTGVSLQQKLHQIYSWTVKFESGNAMTLDTTKAEYIRKNFWKVWIFYIYKQELVALQSIYWDDLTTDLEEFNTTNKSIALQIVSGREWISLALAEDLVFYNISFSAVSYWQARDRLTTKDRKNNNVHWIFTEWGIEQKIYDCVMNKRNYTLSIFKKDYVRK